MDRKRRRGKVELPLGNCWEKEMERKREERKRKRRKGGDMVEHQRGIFERVEMMFSNRGWVGFLN